MEDVSTFACGTCQSGLTTGASSDLEQATHIVRQMICRFGMDEEFGLLAVPELDVPGQGSDAALQQKVNERATRILKEQMDLTAGLLEKHRQQLDDVTKALLEKNRLSRKDLEQLLPSGSLSTRGVHHRTCSKPHAAGRSGL
ncbi:MAG: hypothetical protein NTW87_17240 [Planctomycetota bacterium]|nr:hypothetical protein [Planctomycetota bacterium]